MENDEWVGNYRGRIDIECQRDVNRMYTLYMVFLCSPSSVLCVQQASTSPTGGRTPHNGHHWCSKT